MTLNKQVNWRWESETFCMSFSDKGDNIPYFFLNSMHYPAI